MRASTAGAAPVAPVGDDSRGGTGSASVGLSVIAVTRRRSAGRGWRSRSRAACRSGSARAPASLVGFVRADHLEQALEAREKRRTLVGQVEQHVAAACSSPERDEDRRLGRERLVAGAVRHEAGRRPGPQQLVDTLAASRVGRVHQQALLLRQRLAGEPAGDLEAIFRVEVEVDRRQRFRAGVAQREAHQQRHRPPGGALFAPPFHAVPAMSRCAQRMLAGEAREEAGRGDRAAGARRRCWRSRRSSSLQLLLVVVPERHAARRGPRRRRPRRVSSSASVVVVGEQPACDVAERDDAGAGERGDVDHGRGLEALGVGERVAQDQPAFGVGVEDLDGLARTCVVTMSPGLVARPPGMFSQAG